MTNIAVVGAGLAGISVAQKLKASGHLCSVFEKSRGLGGRLATRRLTNWQVDHGAQYFTVRSELFRAEVERWLSLGWIALWDVEPWKLNRETFSVSPDDQARYVGLPSMNAMIHGLSKELELYTETRIDRLEKQGDQWRLWDGTGEHYGLFDAVILTPPLAQTLALIPAESQLLKIAQYSSMYPTWAFGLSLTEPSGIAANALFSDDGIVTWACKDSTKPGRPEHFETWVIHFSAKWTSNHLDASEELLRQQAINLLERLAGREITIHESFKHRWLYARSSSVNTEVPLWDSVQRIGVAGDWTQGGRLENAWLSAQLLGDQIIESFR